MLQLSNTETERGKDNALVKKARGGGGGGIHSTDPLNTNKTVAVHFVELNTEYVCDNEAVNQFDVLL